MGMYNPYTCTEYILTYVLTPLSRLPIDDGFYQASGTYIRSIMLPAPSPPPKEMKSHTSRDKLTAFSLEELVPLGLPVDFS